MRLALGNENELRSMKIRHDQRKSPEMALLRNRETAGVFFGLKLGGKESKRRALVTAKPSAEPGGMTPTGGCESVTKRRCPCGGWHIDGRSIFALLHLT